MHVCKKLYIHRYLWEKLPFFSVHLRSYTRKNNFFLYIHTHWKTLSLYTDMVYIKSLFLFKDFFSPFQYTLVVYIKISFIYTHCLYIRISFHTEARFRVIIYRYAQIKRRKLSWNSNGHNFSHGCPIRAHNMSSGSKLNNRSSWEIQMVITFHTDVRFRLIKYRYVRN